jgi:hypothetical protein
MYDILDPNAFNRFLPCYFIGLCNPVYLKMSLRPPRKSTRQRGVVRRYMSQSSQATLQKQPEHTEIS